MTQNGTPERLELTDAEAEAYAARREALHAAVLDLDRDLAELETRPDAERLRATLTQTLATVRRHVAEADAPDGLLAQILEEAAWFAARVQQLRAEHGHLLARVASLLERAEATTDVAPLLAEGRAVSAELTRHRDRGTTLLLDAYTLDVTAGD